MQQGHGRIMIVDDNENNRELLARRLKRRGHSIEMAADGIDCLQQLAQKPFDLVILDIMMPRLDGYGVLQRMHEDATWQYIPVIVISAVDELDSVVRCIDLGADDYLLKPFNPVLLHAKIDAALDRKRLRDQEQSFLRILRHEMALGQRAQADFLPPSLHTRHRKRRTNDSHCLSDQDSSFRPRSANKSSRTCLTC